jgi:hypothetical protein
MVPEYSPASRSRRGLHPRIPPDFRRIMRSISDFLNVPLQKVLHFCASAMTTPRNPNSLIGNSLKNDTPLKWVGLKFPINFEIPSSNFVITKEGAVEAITLISEAVI